jgi:hypothetical protein
VVTALQKLRAGEIANRTQLDGNVYLVALIHLRNHLRKDRSCVVSDHDFQADLTDANERGATRISRQSNVRGDSR